MQQVHLCVGCGHDQREAAGFRVSAKTRKPPHPHQHKVSAPFRADELPGVLGFPEYVHGCVEALYVHVLLVYGVACLHDRLPASQPLVPGRLPGVGFAVVVHARLRGWLKSCTHPHTHMNGENVETGVGEPHGLEGCGQS